MFREFIETPVTVKDMIFLTLGMIVMVIGLLIYDSGPIDSYQLTEQYEQGGDIYGERVEIVVHDKGANPMVGEYLWDERDDVSYVTFDRVDLDNVGVGDTVVVEVIDISEVMGVYMIEIDDVEVLGQ